MKNFVLAIFLLGCTGDHVVGSTSAPDAAATGGSGGAGGTGGTGGMPDARPIDAPGVDAFICGASGEPCCPTGRACQGNLRCQQGRCQ